MAIQKQTLKKYKLVVDEWFSNEFNGKQAYLKFYRNVSDNTATTNFKKISQIPEVAEYILEKQELAQRVVEATHVGILNELKNWLQFDITETMGLNKEEIKKLPIGVRRLITGFKTTSRDIYNGKGEVIETVETNELKFVSKEKAMEMINKHIDFYKADRTHDGVKINITTTNETHNSLVQGIIDGVN